MSGIIDKVLQELQKVGLKSKVVSVNHLPELQDDIDKFHRQGLLDKRLSDSYLQFEYGISNVLQNAKSLFIIAVPQPITRTRFTRQSTTYEADIPPTYIGKADDARVKNILTSVMRPAGYRLERARLPVKALAVRSGLAQYGRNNITYISGFGSFHRLVAFYSDCPIDRDDWQELKVMKACENCFKCLNNCPTQCISTERFLVHAENCLTFLNESERNFPDWVKSDWHNALIGCMRCQLICPVNRTQMKKIADGPRFSEKETELILQKAPLEKLPEVTREELASISADDWYEVLARNLSVLIKSQNL